MREIGNQQLRADRHARRIDGRIGLQDRVDAALDGGGVVDPRDLADGLARRDGVELRLLDDDRLGLLDHGLHAVVLLDPSLNQFPHQFLGRLQTRLVGVRGCGDSLLREFPRPRVRREADVGRLRRLDRAGRDAGGGRLRAARVARPRVERDDQDHDDDHDDHQDRQFLEVAHGFGSQPTRLEVRRLRTRRLVATPVDAAPTASPRSLRRARGNATPNCTRCGGLTSHRPRHSVALRPPATGGNRAAIAPGTRHPPPRRSAGPRRV